MATFLRWIFSFGTSRFPRHVWLPFRKERKPVAINARKHFIMKGDKNILMQLSNYHIECIFPRSVQSGTAFPGRWQRTEVRYHHTRFVHIERFFNVYIKQGSRSQVSVTFSVRLVTGKSKSTLRLGCRWVWVLALAEPKDNYCHWNVQESFCVLFRPTFTLALRHSHQRCWSKLFWTQTPPAGSSAPPLGSDGCQMPLQHCNSCTRMISSDLSGLVL